MEKWRRMDWLDLSFRFTQRTQPPLSHVTKWVRVYVERGSHLRIFTSSHVHIFTSSHLKLLHICTSAHLHVIYIFTSARLHIFHLHIFTSSHLHIVTLTLHTFASSLMFRTPYIYDWVALYFHYHPRHHHQLPLNNEACHTHSSCRSGSSDLRSPSHPSTRQQGFDQHSPYSS